MAHRLMWRLNTNGTNLHSRQQIQDQLSSPFSASSRLIPARHGVGITIA
jgi:hypothetical protein